MYPAAFEYHAPTSVKDALKLLGKLKAEERARMETASRSSQPRLPANVPVSGRAAAAVNYALAQVGDAYVYGAAGPSAFDCSGICLSTSGVRTKPGQITLARTPCFAPSLAITLASPIRPCFAVT